MRSNQLCEPSLLTNIGNVFRARVSSNVVHIGPVSPVSISRSQHSPDLKIRQRQLKLRPIILIRPIPLETLKYRAYTDIATSWVAFLTTSKTNESGNRLS